MQVRPYRNRQRDTKSQGWERAQSPGQRTRKKTTRANAVGVLETKIIIPTRKAQKKKKKKQHLAATRAHPEK